MLSRTVSTCVDSCCCPAVTSTARGTPAPSVTKWNLLPNPPFERPRAWSWGSSWCFWRLFLKRLRRPEMPLRRNHRYTTNPSRSDPCDPGESAKLGLHGRTCHRLASDRSSDTPSSKGRIAPAGLAMEPLFAVSRGCHRASVAGFWVCGLSWRCVWVIMFRWIPIVCQ